MPNYGPKAFLCMTTSTLFVESIANRSGRSLFFAIVRVLLQILLHILLTSFFDQVGEEMRERRGTYRWHYNCGPKGKRLDDIRINVQRLTENIFFIVKYTVKSSLIEMKNSKEGLYSYKLLCQNI